MKILYAACSYVVAAQILRQTIGGFGGALYIWTGRALLYTDLLSTKIGLSRKHTVNAEDISRCRVPLSFKKYDIVSWIGTK